MKKIGVFTGSFDPLHIGHLNIIQQAERIFDEVIVAVGENTEKEKSEIDRAETIKLQLRGKRVERFTGLLIDYVKSLENEGQVTIIRGLRNSSDLLYEINMLRVLKDMDPFIEVIYLVCDRKYEHISSSMIRSLEKTQIGCASEYLVKPEMFEMSNEFAPRIKMSERYSYEKLILGYDLEKVKHHFEGIINNYESGHRSMDHSVMDAIKKELKDENFIGLVFNHLLPFEREQFLKEDLKNNIWEIGDKSYVLKKVPKIEQTEKADNSNINDIQTSLYFIHPKYPKKEMTVFEKEMQENLKEHPDGWVEFHFAPGYKFKNIKIIYRRSGNAFEHPDGLYLEYNGWKKIIECDKLESKE